LSDPEIRRLRPEELEAVVRMWRRSREDAQPWLEARMGHSPDDDLRHFRDVIASKYEVWVAAEAGLAVGLLALADGHVDQLYVDPAAQRRGVGTALIEHARSLFPSGLRLFTHQRNARARAFYEKLGFRVIRFGVSPPPESEPDVAYAWEPESE
jgi:ribosomal protein S18 acetylase RimI-like enzyme